MFQDEQVVKRGSWLYDGLMPAAIVITRGDMFFGSGDDEDEAVVREDREIDAFRIWFESPPGSNTYPACGGQFCSIEEAISAVEKLLPSKPRWE